MKCFIPLILGPCLFFCANGCYTRTMRTETRAPQSIPDVLKTAKADFQRGKLARAESEYRDVLARDSNNNEAWYFLHLIAESQANSKLREDRLEQGNGALLYPTLPPKQVR